MTPFDYAAGVAMAFTGLFIAFQAWVGDSPHLGWKTKPLPIRLAMAPVAILMGIRAYTVFHGQPINPVGRCLSLFMLLWQFSAFLHVVTQSWSDETGHRRRDAKRSAALALRNARKIRQLKRTMCELQAKLEVEMLMSQPVAQGYSDNFRRGEAVIAESQKNRDTP